VPKKIAPKGSSEAFLRRHISVETDACVLWPYRLTKAGYGLAVIDGKQLHAHRWMCILAHGEPAQKDLEAAHGCGNRNCVNPNHLRWDTRSGNQQDRVLHGTSNRGERDGMAKLSESQVLEILKMKGLVTGVDLAKKYNVRPNTITRIWSGQRWPHLGIKFRQDQERAA